MTLQRIINANGDALPVCELPSTLLSSRNGLVNFFRLHASRIYGNEGRDFRVIVKPEELCPVYVNQIVIDPATGKADYGESLVAR